MPSARYFIVVLFTSLSFWSSTMAVAADSAMAYNQSLEQARSRIPRLQAVSETLLRGGQPDEEGFSLLKQAGIKTIINLRGKGPAEKQEKSLVKSLGLNYFNLPMRGSKRVPAAYPEQFLQLVNEPQLEPVFVHCKQGVDRTGAMVAIYRMRCQGWRPSAAYNEMIACGFHPMLRNLTRSVFDYGATLGKPEPLPPLHQAISDLGKELITFSRTCRKRQGLRRKGIKRHA